MKVLLTDLHAVFVYMFDELWNEKGLSNTSTFHTQFI